MIFKEEKKIEQDAKVGSKEAWLHLHVCLCNSACFLDYHHPHLRPFYSPWGPHTLLHGREGHSRRQEAVCAWVSWNSVSTCLSSWPTLPSANVQKVEHCLLTARMRTSEGWFLHKDLPGTENASGKKMGLFSEGVKCVIKSQPGLSNPWQELTTGEEMVSLGDWPCEVFQKAQIASCLWCCL